MIAVTPDAADLAGHRITTMGRCGRRHTATCLCGDWAGQASSARELEQQFLDHAATAMGICWMCGTVDDRRNRETCGRCWALWCVDHGLDPRRTDATTVTAGTHADEEPAAVALEHALGRTWRDLARLPVLYEAAWPFTLVVAIASADPSRSGARSGRPGPRLPRGTDVDARRLLVTAGQRIATAHLALVESPMRLRAALTSSWVGLGQETDGDGWSWTDPSDMAAAALLPAGFELAVDQLRSACAELPSFDLDDPAARRPARQVVAEAARAAKALDRTGVAVPQPDPRKIRRCSVGRCGIAVHADGLCRSHWDAVRRRRAS